MSELETCFEPVEPNQFCDSLCFFWCPVHLLVSSIYMGAINLYMQERFSHLLIPLLFPCLQCIHMQEYAVHSPIRLLFPWVQCQSSKPVLSQCSQTSFVTVDDFIGLYTRSHIFYSHGCNKFPHAVTFFTLTDKIAQIFTVITKVWPSANWAVVTNNLTVIIKAMLIEGLIYIRVPKVWSLGLTLVF